MLLAVTLFAQSVHSGQRLITCPWQPLPMQLHCVAHTIWRDDMQAFSRWFVYGMDAQQT